MANGDEHKQHVSDHDLLIRIDEQLRSALARLDVMQKHHKEDISEIKKVMVTKNELKPVKAIAYSIVSVVGCTVLIAIIGSVIQ